MKQETKQQAIRAFQILGLMVIIITGLVTYLAKVDREASIYHNNKDVVNTIIVTEQGDTVKLNKYNQVILK